MLRDLALAKDDVCDLCLAAVAIIVDELATQRVAVHELDESQRILSRVALHGDGEDAFTASSMLVGNAPLAQRALATGSAAATRDDPCSMVSAPIAGCHRSFGVLTVCASRGNAFGRDEIEFVEAVANLLAIGIARARAGRDARDGRRALALLAAASHDLAQCRERASVIETAMRLAVPALADLCILDLSFDEESTQRFMRHRDDETPAQLEITTVLAPSGTPCEPRIVDLAASADPVAELASDQHCAELLRQVGAGSVLRIPMHARERQVGVLWLGADDRRGAFDAPDLGIAADLARRISMALDNARFSAERVESDRRQEELLAMLSHELRNPLAGIVNNLELLRVEQTQPATRQYAVDAIGRQSHFISRIVDDLLDVSRITRGAIELHRTGIGRGSEFVVSLPRIDAPCVPHGTTTTALAGARETEAGNGAVLKIVVVDDHRDSALGLAELMRTWGHDVHIAFDGPSGLALVRAVRPALAILDIGLPGLDGHAVARAIRATPELEALRLVAVTGYGYAEDRRKALDAGFDQFFTKPLDASSMRQVIRDTQSSDGRM